MRRALGLVGMILGVIGIVVSLVLVPLVWIGRNAADDAINAVSETIVTPLSQANQATSDLLASLQQMQDRLQQASTQADQAAQTGAIGLAVGQRLTTALDDLVGPEYVRMRESYIALRERVTTAATTLQRLQRIMPLAPQPDLPIAELQAIDQNLTQIDTTLRQLRSGDLELSNGGPGSAALTRVAQGLRTTEGAVSNVSDRAAMVDARLTKAQETVQQTTQTAHTITLVAALVATLVCLYGALLHLALYASSRAWRH
jgi:hypothetical protein